MQVWSGSPVPNKKINGNAIGEQTPKRSESQNLRIAAQQGSLKNKQSSDSHHAQGKELNQSQLLLESGSTPDLLLGGLFDICIWKHGHVKPTQPATKLKQFILLNLLTRNCICLKWLNFLLKHQTSASWSVHADVERWSCTFGTSPFLQAALPRVLAKW